MNKQPLIDLINQEIKKHLAGINNSMLELYSGEPLKTKAPLNEKEIEQWAAQWRRFFVWEIDYFIRHKEMLSILLRIKTVIEVDMNIDTSSYFLGYEIHAGKRIIRWHRRYKLISISSTQFRSSARDGRKKRVP